MNKTTIEYLDYTWNPIAMRCTPVSIGCVNCWHLRLCNRMAANPNFSDEIRAAYAGKSPPRIIEKRLEEPGHTKKGGIVGVQFMGDLFHDDVDDETIMGIIDVMLDTPYHTYQILTKRPKRMKWIIDDYLDYIVSPLPDNIWLGVTAENQEMADERIPVLLQIPASVRFVSVEPMLGAIDLSPYLGYNTHIGDTGYENNKRRNTLRAGENGRVENRQSWEGVENKEWSASEGREKNSARIFTSEKDDKRNTSPHRSASLGIPSLFRENTDRKNNQSQRRNKGQQPSLKFGNSNIFGEHETRFQDGAKRTVGTGKSSEQINKRGDCNYSRNIRTGESNTSGDCEELQCISPDNIKNCEGGQAQDGKGNNRGLHDDETTKHQERFRGQIHQVICGGETGHGAREMKLEWAWSLAQQCGDANIPFFFKKFGDAYTGARNYKFAYRREYPEVNK